MRPDGTVGWQGGKDLASSADFTALFCKTVCKYWKEEFQCEVSRPIPLISVESDSEVEFLFSMGPLRL